MSGNIKPATFRLNEDGIDKVTRNNINQMQQLEEYEDLKSDNDLL